MSVTSLAAEASRGLDDGDLGAALDALQAAASPVMPPPTTSSRVTRSPGLPRLLSQGGRNQLDQPSHVIRPGWCRADAVAEVDHSPAATHDVAGVLGEHLPGASSRAGSIFPLDRGVAAEQGDRLVEGVCASTPTTSAPASRIAVSRCRDLVPKCTRGSPRSATAARTVAECSWAWSTYSWTISEPTHESVVRRARPGLRLRPEEGTRGPGDPGEGMPGLRVGRHQRAGHRMVAAGAPLHEV